ncbi:MAG: hypothetical protein EXR66_09190 [Dehalococcoidia bacterium]|nr:hypothetical protein [Dehalococcoidia bacterium]
MTAGEEPDLDAISGFGAIGNLGFGNPGSPADYLAHLKSIDGAITVIGSEQVRSVATTRYRGALNMAQPMQAEARAPEELVQFDAALPLLGVLSLPYDAWIDSEGLPRRMSTTLDVGAFGLGGAGAPTTGTAPAMVFTYELFEYGSPEVIDLPAASQVTVVDAATFDSFGF